MSKNHKKHYRAPTAVSTIPEKASAEKPKTEKPEEPIKLERVLLSDDFYWEVPGDVPASDRRFGMKMVPPGIPKPDASIETSNLSSSMTNRSEEADTKSATESKAPVDTAIQEQNNTTDHARDIESKEVSEAKPTFVASKQAPTDTINRDEDVVAEPKSENKSKVAASLLPQTDTGRLDTTQYASPTTRTTEAKVDTRLDSSQQQTIIASRRIEPEQVVPSQLKDAAIKDKPTRWWRPAWIALLLLLALGGALYDVLFNEDDKVTTVINRVEQPVVEQYQPEQVDVIMSPIDEINTNNIAASNQVQTSDATAVAKTEAGQLKQVRFITHVVVKGDTLWDISNKYLNDPFRYPELAELSNIKNPDLIYPGEIITIATTQPAESGIQAQVSDKTVAANVETSQLKQILFSTHIVVKGDTLWDISKKYLNNPFRYPELAKLSKIKNPDLIYPGDIVRIQNN